jgi:UDP-N-acetylmuramoyl-tripeptide--D-alanyl-D-alanine ligase
VAALVDREPAVDLPNLRFIRVADTRAALGRLATFVRQQLTVCKVICVAGSNGKTSTKHLISAALSCRLRGSVSPKSFNNDIGVPLTIFPADPIQDYLVLELGTNHPGEIARLGEMARPDIAVITNCSAEHLEGLGDLMGVRQENASIIRGLNPRGLLVVNGDDPQLLEAVRSYAGKIVRFGFDPGNDVFATDIRPHDDGTSFLLNGRRSARVFVPMLGRHNACNALAAIAVARRFGLPEEEFLRSLAVSSKPEMRLQLTRLPHVTLLNDAYNANPASMRAALETLLTISAARRRVIVLGEMRELGPSSERYHRELGRTVGGMRDSIDQLVCVGPMSRWIQTEAIRGGFGPKSTTFCENATEAAQKVAALLRRDDLVLLKGSRGVRLETVADAIIAWRGPRSRVSAS